MYRLNFQKDIERRPILSISHFLLNNITCVDKILCFHLIKIDKIRNCNI